MKTRFAFPSWLLTLLALAAPHVAVAQEKSVSSADERARLVAAARQIMGAQTYCALITVDEAGRPQVRTSTPSVEMGR